MPLEAMKQAIKQFGPILVQSLGQTETLNGSVIYRNPFYD